MLNKTVNLESPVKRLVTHLHGQSINDTTATIKTGLDAAPSNLTTAEEDVEIAEDGHERGEGREEELPGGNSSVESEGAREDSARAGGLQNSSLGRAEAEGGS